MHSGEVGTQTILGDDTAATDPVTQHLHTDPTI